MKTKFGIVYLVIVLGGALGCTSMAQQSNNMPNWVNDPYTEFSQDRFLLAVGSGSTQQEAQNSALANLSRIFQSNIESEQKLIDEFREYTENNEISSEYTSQLLTVTHVGSSQNLINTKILKTHDSKARVYALAGMERLETARIYSSEISRNEMRINNLTEMAENESSMLLKLGYVKKALMLAEVNMNLIAQKNVIQRGATSSELEQQSRNGLQQWYNEIKKNIKVYISENNSLPGKINTAATNAFDTSGFSVVANKPALLFATVSFSTEEVDLQRENAAFVRWNLQISITDERNNTELDTYSAEGREGALSYKEAKFRAVTEASDKIESEFTKFIDQQLLSN